MSRNLLATFDEVYRAKRWTDAGNGSGPGSEPERCSAMMADLVDFINERQIRTIVDVSCGGMAWWPLVLDQLDDKTEFWGFDASSIVTDRNRRQWQARRNWNFDIADARTGRYPEADLVVCRQTLNHLWPDDAHLVVRNLLSQAPRFIAFTDNEDVVTNSGARQPLFNNDASATCYAPLNLRQPPFNLGEPVASMQDVAQSQLSVFLSPRSPRASFSLMTGYCGPSLPRMRSSPAPRDQSFFFCSDERFRSVIEEAGWTFVRDDRFTGDVTDIKARSVHSKSYKFLEVLDESAPERLRRSRHIVWADHRRIPISEGDLNRFLHAHVGPINQWPAITIRSTPRHKYTLQMEMADAVKAERYAKTMPAVEAQVAEFERSGRGSSEVRICNTGLIVFDTDHPMVGELARQILDATRRSDNPECQIFFAMFRQCWPRHLVNIVPYSEHPSLIGLTTPTGNPNHGAAMTKSLQQPRAAMVVEGRPVPDVARSNNYEFAGDPWRGFHLVEIYNQLVDPDNGPARWPDGEVQQRYTGTKGIALLRMAFQFVNMLDDDGAFSDGWRGFDYGCGWGRFASVLLTKGTPEQLDLFDAWLRTIELIRGLGYRNQIRQVQEELHPGAMPAGAYDVGLSFSVFTHLAPSVFAGNLQVLLGTLKPNGRLYITVRHPDFIDHKYPDQADELGERVESNGICFIENGDEPGSRKVYGDTVIDPDYLEKLVGSHGAVKYMGRSHRVQHVYRLTPRPTAI